MHALATNYPAVLIRARALTGFATLVGRHGADCAALLGAAGIRAKVLDEPESTLPMARVITLLNGSAERLAAPDFGLQLAQLQDIDVLGAVALVARNCATLGEALAAIARNMSYHSPGLKLALEEDPLHTGMMRLRLALDPGAALPLRQAMELSMGVALRFLTSVTGQSGAGWQVGFRHDSPLSAAEYGQHWRASVRLEQDADTLSLPARLLATSISPYGTALQAAAERHVGNLIRRNPLDLSQQVEALVDRQLATGGGTLVQVARQMGLHERTLQRRLKEQAVYFEDIVDGLRRSRAEQYLAQSTIPLAEVSSMLGYTEQSSFIRCCKRWFDTTPQVFRNLYSGFSTT